MTPVDETADQIEADYALNEEEDVQPLGNYAQQMSANTPTHRRLRAMAGADIPYLFLTFPPNGQVSLDFWGVAPAQLPELLTTVAGAVQQ